jgi:hypothetical protein
MNTKSKLEQVLELVINEDTDRASDLLHDIFVEKSRQIYADLVEEDAAVEDVIEEEELEEAIDDSDMEDDFIEDISDAEEEIQAEEMFGEAEDEDEAEAELADELAGEEGEEEEAEAEEGAESEAEEAMMNVEDALAELKAAFAALVGDAEHTEPDGDEGEGMEGPESDMDGDELPVELGEGAELKAVKVAHTDGTDNGKSPVGPGEDMGGETVKIAGAEEKGGKAPAAKDMGVTGPQEAGGFRKTKG